MSTVSVDNSVGNNCGPLIFRWILGILPICLFFGQIGKLLILLNKIIVAGANI